MIRTYLFLITALYLVVSTNVFAQDKILIGKIAVSPKAEASVMEPILLQRIKEESVKNGFSVEIKTFASTEEGLKVAERDGFSFTQKYIVLLYPIYHRIFIFLPFLQRISISLTQSLRNSFPICLRE